MIEAPKKPAELFQPGAAQPVVNIVDDPDVFPLRGLSRFVFSEQPGVLNNIRAGTQTVRELVDRQATLARGLGNAEIQQVLASLQLSRVASLDLSFATNAVIFSGGTPPAEIDDLRRLTSAVGGIPEIMTFEKIISINSRLPYPFMRTYTNGEIGKTERHFYYGHEIMDIRMQGTIGLITNAVDQLKEPQNPKNIEQATANVQQSAENMDEFLEYMRAFMRMNKKHFEIIRPYLKAYPDGRRNASGAFIGMPRLGLRVVGSAPFFEQFLDAGMSYFPVEEQPDIQSARENADKGQYLVSQIEGLDGRSGQSELALVTRALIDSNMQFRLVHLGAVEKFVKGAVDRDSNKHLLEKLETPYEDIIDPNSAEVVGTAGFLAGPLLRNMLRLDHQAMKRLAAVRGEVS